MMDRSTMRSKQRPDTLMQDRSYRIDENLLQRTAGPYIGPCVDGSGLARRIFTLQRWSEQPCVRPVSAVHMTAGHNALRGSGPGQKHAFEDAVAHVGCPDRRIDRRCITCCSPSQPSRHAGVSGCDLVYAARAAGSL